MPLQSNFKLVAEAPKISLLRIALQDFFQAYLQSKGSLIRKVCIRPFQEGLDILGANNCDLLQLMNQLYGICDSGDYWNDTFMEFTKKGF